MHFHLKLFHLSIVHFLDIYIDEFLGFTAQEYKVFEKLIRICKEVTVSVATDNLDENTNKEKDIFYFNKKYANKLIKIADEQGAKVEKHQLLEKVRFKNEELKFLEENFEKYKSEYTAKNEKNYSYNTIKKDKFQNLKMNKSLNRYFNN